MVITGLSFLLPSAPGGIGVYHFFCQMSLVAIGTDRAEAIAASIIIHAALFMTVTVVGLIVVGYCVWKFEADHKSIWTSVAEVPNEID